jgi:hypothetical protein
MLIRTKRLSIALESWKEKFSITLGFTIRHQYHFKCACLLTTCFPVPTVFVWFPHIKTGCFLHIVSFPPVHWQQEVDV